MGDPAGSPFGIIQSVCLPIPDKLSVTVSPSGATAKSEITGVLRIWGIVRSSSG